MITIDESILSSFTPHSVGYQAAPAGPARTAELSRLLVIDPDPASRDRVLRLCGESRLFQVAVVASVDEANLKMIAAEDVFFDVAAAPSLDQLSGELARLNLLQDGAVGIAITSPLEDLDTRVAASRAGADTFLVKPLSRYAIQDAVQIMRSRPMSSQKRVLVVDDDPDFVALVEAMLTHADYSVIGITDSEPLLDHLRRHRPDAVLIDLGMPGYDGVALTSMLRNSAKFDNIPVLFLSGHDDDDSIRAAFAAGADDFLVKPVRAEDLVSRLEARIERSRRMRTAAEREPLTGLLTRAPFLASLENRIASNIRNGTQSSLCLMDLDTFKKVNDAHGHDVGDQVLAAFGQLLRYEFRDEDLKCRWGGEEFMMGFPQDQTIQVTHRMIERLLTRFSAMKFTGANGELFSLTFSAGISQFSAKMSGMDELIKLADERLYLAKSHGRSLVVSWG